MRVYFKQKDRLYVMLLYLSILFFINYIIFDSLFPPQGAKGLWFYSGVASVLLGNFLVTPFYTKPVDAISYSVLALIAIYSLNNWANWIIADKVVFIFTLISCFLVLIFSFISIITKDSKSVNVQKWSKTLRIIVDDFGNQSFIFSLVIIYALIIFHRNSPKEMFFITLAWIITVVIRPDKYLIKLYYKIMNLWSVKIINDVIGDIEAYQNPDLILIKQTLNKKMSFGTQIIFKDNFNNINFGFILDYKDKNKSKLLRAITNSSISEEIEDIESFQDISNDKVFTYDNSDIKEVKVEEFVGLVTSNTNIEYLIFEVIKEKEIEEGRLVEVLIKGESVLYQIIDGITQEEIIYQKNKYGYAKGKARKIGIWDDEKQRFKPAKWIPKINSPVYIKINKNYEPQKNTIGHFPGSNYNVGIKNIHHLVNHNTAIVGILGIGKSMLSIELIERIIKENIKVVCLDLTNQYKNELDDFYNEDVEKEKIKKIQKAGFKDKDSWEDDPQFGGSIPNFTKAIFDDLQKFLNDDENFLKIYNPSELFATKQITEPKSFTVDGNWQRNATLWTITPVEITKIISEQLLELLNDKMSIEARVCLVLEEAHSLVPEFHTVVTESDKNATNGTARVILQGRKYGLGCLLISQRTANVTKTILNQCNTIFAMRTFDDTGKGFLSNYIGNEYSQILSTLKERQAVFYGKASTCENPVILRLNDQDEFRRVFRGF